MPPVHPTPSDARRLPFGAPTALACAAVLFASCKQAPTTVSRENVAKDWCATIRASQVMPVYPLTQDLQPGDVFLVQVPIERQRETWRDAGYLPLDNHLSRMFPKRYPEFYAHSLAVEASSDRLPIAHLAEAPTWERAPRAAFPTYAFSVRDGGGHLALPVGSVPVALSLLGASSAEGTVSIGKARTLGIDTVSLDHQLREEWLPQHRAFLAGFASAGGAKNYVRVISRVYLTGDLDVSVRARDDGADEGSPVAVVLPGKNSGEATAATLQGYQQAIDELNGLLRRNVDRDGGVAEASLTTSPGGTLRIVSASARSIAMKETFEPPLVLGYLGFDYEIGPGGWLGPAVPTYAAISGTAGPESFSAARPEIAPWLEDFWPCSYQLAKARSAVDPDALAIVEKLDALAQFAPESWEAWRLASEGHLEQVAVSPEQEWRGNYEIYRRWRSDQESSARNLAEAKTRSDLVVRRNVGVPVSVEPGSPDAKDLEARGEAIERQLEADVGSAQHDAARRALANWLFARLYVSGHPAAK